MEDREKSQRSTRRISLPKLPVAAATARYSIWSTPIRFSGVPWCVWTCTEPGRLTTECSKLTLLKVYFARAITSQYRLLPITTLSTSPGMCGSSFSFTRNTDRMCGASSRALRWIAAGLQA